MLYAPQAVFQSLTLRQTTETARSPFLWQQVFGVFLMR